MKLLMRMLFSAILALTAFSAAQAKLVVEQIYSNASGSIQFIVFAAEGDYDCDPFSFSNGLWNYVSMYGLPSKTASGRILVANGGFASLGVAAPDLVTNDPILQLGGGFFRFCDGSVFSYGRLPADGVTALDRSGSPVPNLAMNSLGASGSVTADVAATAPMMLTAGHTGSWYEAVTAGQGFEIDVWFDDDTWDTNVFAGWFTYDEAATNGPEGQRWYTLSGTVVFDVGDTFATLDIYRNTGGNFDSPPITAASKVGTATLRFTACDRGTLEYAFTDGSGRVGSIPISRITQNVNCHPTEVPSSRDTSFNLSGNWYDPTTLGQGISVELNPMSRVAFLAWYTYAPHGESAGVAGQRWYTAQGPFAEGMRTASMTLYETTGGRFDALTVPPPRTSAVGDATLEFENCSNATLTYAFTGGTSAGAKGAIRLVRSTGTARGCGL